MSSSSSDPAAAAHLLAETVTFPISGHQSRNRLLKAPMEELLASLGPSSGSDGASSTGSNAASAGGRKVPPHMPNAHHLSLYRAWAANGWGTVVTGNVAIDATHLGTPFDIALPPLRARAAELLKAHASASSKAGAEAAARTVRELWEDADAILESFVHYARAVKGLPEGSSERSNGSSSSDRPLAICQLVHAGRQSLRGSGRSPFRRPWAPSAVPMRPSTKGVSSASLSPTALLGAALDRLMWSTPHAMTLDEIQHLKRQFLAAALLCQAAGFDGVELHASHGYMLAAFLSPKTNIRTDQYGGDARGRARLLLELAQETKQLCGKGFAVGVKLNSADYVAGGLTEEDALQNVLWLAETGCIDFTEISGGNYENPSFMSPDGFNRDEELEALAANGSGAKSSAAAARKKQNGSARTNQREAFFQAFAQRARQALDERDQSSSSKPPLLCITGGLRSRAGMAAAVQGARVDMVGVGRYAAVYPDLPLRVTNASVPDVDAQAKSDPPVYELPSAKYTGLIPLKMVGAGWGTLWHSAQLHFVAKTGKADPRAGFLSVVPAVFSPTAPLLSLRAVIAWLAVVVAAFVAARWKSL